MSALHHLTLAALAAALERRTISSVEATQACLARAAATERLHAFLHIDSEGALQTARAADARRSTGAAKGLLDGVPIGLKDNFLTSGLPTTCASRILENFVAPYDGTAVQRLKAAGTVLLGKQNLDEFAMGGSTEYAARGPTKNPWDPRRVPGGSSGGSAASVCTGSSFASLGTDTGGSIRQPAAFTGIVGLKPTYGRISRFGVIAFASSLDQVGPMTKDVTDCAILLQAIAGADPRDATCAATPVADYRLELEAGVRGMRLGVPQEYLHAPGIDPEVAAGVETALAHYEKLGAVLVPVSLPHTHLGVATYYILAPAEASSNLARYDGVRYGVRCDPGTGLLDMYTHTRAAGFGAEVKRRILLGTYVLSSGYYDAYYRRAQKVRTLVCNDFEQVFTTCDALLTPTTPTAAYPLGEHHHDPIRMYAGDVFTVAANLAGLPALSLPCGLTTQQLPIGLQILGAPWQEAKVLRIARAYERDHSWQHRRPT